MKFRLNLQKTSHCLPGPIFSHFIDACMWLKLNELTAILVEKMMALLMICFSKSIITSTRRQQRVAPSPRKSGPAIFGSDKTSSWHENERAKYISKPESIEITMCNPLTKAVCLFLDATLQLFDTLNLNRHYLWYETKGTNTHQC